MAVAIVIMGPMGCGKTTVGMLLAKKLGWLFEDADDFHPEENVKKMAAGIPLTDEDRLPWLQLLQQRMQGRLSTGENCILACSALRQSYRQILGVDQKQILSVYLKGTPEQLHERLIQRNHPYMDNDLLASQFEALEEPKDGIQIEVSAPPEKIVATLINLINNSAERKDNGE